MPLHLLVLFGKAFRIPVDSSVNLLVFVRNAGMSVSDYSVCFSHGLLRFSEYSSSKSLESLYITTIMATIIAIDNTILTDKNRVTAQCREISIGRNSAAITLAMILFFMFNILY